MVNWTGVGLTKFLIWGTQVNDIGEVFGRLVAVIIHNLRPRRKTEVNVQSRTGYTTHRSINKRATSRGPSGPSTGLI